MKKIIYSLTVLFLAAFTLAACEDVPAPYQIPSSENEGGADIEATGNGTADNPFNCAAALDYINSLEADVESDTAIYIKGKVVSIVENYDGGFGNATFYISDDGTTENKFYVYRSYYLNNQKYTSGTLLAIGDEVVIYGKVVNYKGNTPETVQNNNYLYSLNGNKGDGGSTEEGVATGDGTLENPFNSVAANQYASTLESGATSDVVYIKGKVVSIKEQYGTQYGNATFYISDDGTAANQLYVFRALYLNNEKYTSGNLLAVGDEVVICGKLTNYMGNTPETVQGEAYLYSLNGNKGDGGSTGGDETDGKPTGDGTLENPFNSVAANQYASKLEADATSDVVYIKGKVVSIKEQYGTQYGNATFYISDDGTAANQFYVYRAFYLNNEKYTSGTLLAVGDDVVICGQLTNYMGNTPETVQGKAYLYSLTSNGGGTGGDTGGDVTENSIKVTASALGIDNGVGVPTLTLSDGTTISFDGGGNNNTPKYYTSGSAVRMYPKNFMTITSSKTIKSVVLNCVEASNVPCTAEGKVTANPGTVSTDNLTVTIANVNNNQTVITNSNGSTGTASQLRWSSLVINYAE